MFQRCIQLTIVCFLLATSPVFCKSLSLDLRNPDFFKYKQLKPYMVELRKSIEEKWVGSRIQKGKIEVFFELDSDGNLLDLKLVKGTTDSVTDESTLNAVKWTFPYSAPPPTSKSSLKIKALFDCDPKSRPKDIVFNRAPENYEQEETFDPNGNYQSGSNQYLNGYQPEPNGFSNQPQYLPYQYLPNYYYSPPGNYSANENRQVQSYLPYYQPQPNQYPPRANYPKNNKQGYDKESSQLNNSFKTFEKIPSLDEPSVESSETNSMQDGETVPPEEIETQSGLKEDDSNTPSDSLDLPSSPPETLSNDSSTSSADPSEVALSPTEDQSNLNSNSFNDIWWYPAGLSLIALLIAARSKKKTENTPVESLAESEEVESEIDSIVVELEEISDFQKRQNFEPKQRIEERLFENTTGVEEQVTNEYVGFSEMLFDEPFFTFLEMESVRIVVEFEKNQGRTITDVSRQNVGYDLISCSDSEERHIEVKGKARKGIVLLTPNEWRTAQAEANGYYLYIVENLLSDNRTLKIIQNPYSQMTPDSSRYLYVLQRSKYSPVAESILTNSFMKGLV